MSAPLPACVARLTDEQVRRRLVEAQNEALIGSIRLVNRPGLPFRLHPFQREVNERMSRVLENVEPFYRMERNEKPSWYVRWWKRIRHAKETRK